MINTAMDSAIQGLHTHQQRFSGFAQRISRFGTGGKELPDNASSLERDLVGIMTSRRGYQANLKVLKVADEMLGSLIDILA